MIRPICRGMAAIALATAGTASAPAAERGAIGLWATPTQGGRVEIYRCGDALCGRVVDAARLRADPDLRDVHNSDPRLRDRRLKGLVVLRDFHGGPAQWQGGAVYDPETGDGASQGYMRLLPDGRLEIKGCIAFLCRTKIWTRASGQFSVSNGG